MWAPTRVSGRGPDQSVGIKLCPAKWNQSILNNQSKESVLTYNKIELLVLVAQREWYTRSHSEHGS